MTKFFRALCAVVAVAALCFRRDFHISEMFSWSPEGWEHEERTGGPSPLQDRAATFGL